MGDALSLQLGLICSEHLRWKEFLSAVKTTIPNLAQSSVCVWIFETKPLSGDSGGIQFRQQMCYLLEKTKNTWLEPLYQEFLNMKILVESLGLFGIYLEYVGLCNKKNE